MNVLLTGAGKHSFIGRNLKELLQPRFNLFAVSHQELDCGKYQELKEFIINNKIDIIIHSANYSVLSNDSQNEYLENMRMYLNIIDMRKLVKKIIYFGSGAEYDKSLDISMVKESDFGRSIPQNQYGLAKYTMNTITTSLDNVYNLRLFGIYGKYENPYLKFISNLCCKAIYDQPLTIRKDCNFDYMYIDDLADIVEWFINNEPKFHDYNIACGSPTSLVEIANKVKKVSGKDLSIELLNQEKNLDYTADNQRLLDEYDYKFTKIDKGIQSLYNYYLDNIKEVDEQKIVQSR